MNTDLVYPVSNSRLSAFKRSPLHLIHYLNGNTKQTPAMAFGSAFHAALLEPDHYATEYLTAPEVDRRSKEGKLAYDKFVYEADGKTVITSDDSKRIQRMVDAIRSNAVANELLTNCLWFEQNAEWVNMETSVPMRGIIDAMSSDYIIDVKTTTDASPGKFIRDAFANYYHRQAAIYLDSQNQTKRMDYYLIAIEKDEPHGVCVYQLDAEALDKGHEIYLDQVTEYRSWVEAGCPSASYEYWHYAGIHQIELPNYLKL